MIPVYQGENHLPVLVAELDRYREPFRSPRGAMAQLAEVVLVYDHGPDDSARVMRELSDKHDYVRTVWLSRNFGQHAATLAGMSASGGDWIVTMDEDGQQDPADMVGMLDTALGRGASVVYGLPANPPPHGALRNGASLVAKWLMSRVMMAPAATTYNSYRLVLGEVGRSVAAYAGSGVYLDVALGWVAGGVVTSPVTLRAEGRKSGYRLRTLASHFWRMVVTSGTGALRLVSFLGMVFALVGFGFAAYVVVARLSGVTVERGWSSIITVVLISSGAILFSLGVIAEYIGVAVNMAMGKPLYLVVTDPAEGPLGRGPDDG